jgi:hypothetical protein
MPLFDPRMYGNHVGLVRPERSKRARERKRQNALGEKKNKATVLVWWFNCTCARVASKVALAMCEDEEEWPEGRPGASLFSLIGVRQ